MAKRPKSRAPKRVKPRAARKKKAQIARTASFGGAKRFIARSEFLAPQRNGIATTREPVGALSDAQALELARRCRIAALEKKGEDVVMLDIRRRANFADYFVLATGRSLIQARGIADAVVEACEDEYGAPVRTEGYNEGGWILVDYGAVILHVFLPQTREFYNLERLWGTPNAPAKKR